MSSLIPQETSSPTTNTILDIKNLSVDDHAIEATENSKNGARTTDAETQTPIRYPKLKPDGPKQSNPFEFGSRFLEPGMTGFEFNAWDHVETDDEFKQYAEKQYAFHRENPVTDFDKSELYLILKNPAQN